MTQKLGIVACAIQRGENHLSGDVANAAIGRINLQSLEIGAASRFVYGIRFEGTRDSFDAPPEQRRDHAETVAFEQSFESLSKMSIETETKRTDFPRQGNTLVAPPRAPLVNIPETVICSE